MTNELKIEHYLHQVVRELTALPVTQRSEIITELKAKILEAMAAQPQTEIDRIFFDLGTPRAVAERYLSARGIAYVAPKRKNAFVKWLAIGTVAFFGLIFFSGMMLIWYFSPLVRVDEQRGRVVLLNGLIDLDEKNIGQVKIGDLIVNGGVGEGVEVKGEQAVGQAVRSLKIPFNTAKLDLSVSSNGKLSWDCKAASNVSPDIGVVAGVMTLNLDKLNIARCVVAIPQGMNTQVRGVNGHMDIEHPGGALDIALDNGKVNIHPDPHQVYDFEVKVKNGLQDFFPRSTSKEALKVKVSVVNGMVKKQ